MLPKENINKLSWVFLPKVHGTWTLEVTAIASGDTGVLLEWALIVPACESRVSYRDGVLVNKWLEESWAWLEKSMHACLLQNLVVIGLFAIGP